MFFIFEIFIATGVLLSLRKYRELITIIVLTKLSNFSITKIYLFFLFLLFSILYISHYLYRLAIIIVIELFIILLYDSEKISIKSFKRQYFLVLSSLFLLFIANFHVFLGFSQFIFLFDCIFCIILMKISQIKNIKNTWISNIDKTSPEVSKEFNFFYNNLEDDNKKKIENNGVYQYLLDFSKYFLNDSTLFIEKTILSLILWVFVSFKDGLILWYIDLEYLNIKNYKLSKNRILFNFLIKFILAFCLKTSNDWGFWIVFSLKTWEIITNNISKSIVYQHFIIGLVIGILSVEKYYIIALNLCLYMSKSTETSEKISELRSFLIPISFKILLLEESFLIIIEIFYLIFGSNYIVSINLGFLLGMWISFRLVFDRFKLNGFKFGFNDEFAFRKEKLHKEINRIFKADNIEDQKKLVGLLFLTKTKKINENNKKEDKNPVKMFNIVIFISSVNIVTYLFNLFYGISMIETLSFQFLTNLFLFFMFLMAYFFEKSIPNQLWEIYSKAILSLFILFPMIFKYDNQALYFLTLILIVVFSCVAIGFELIKAQNWIISAKIINLFINFFLFTLIFEFSLLRLFPNLESIILILIYSEISFIIYLYYQMQGRKLTKNAKLLLFFSFCLTFFLGSFRKSNFLNEIFCFSLFFCGIFLCFSFFSSHIKRSKEPISFDFGLFPAYKLNSKQLKLENFSNSILKVFLSIPFFLLIVDFIPFYIDLFLTILNFYTILIFLIVLENISDSQTILSRSETEYNTNKLIQKAWKISKNNFLAGNSARSLDDLIDYSNIISELNVLQQEILKLEPNYSEKPLKLIDSSKKFAFAALKQAIKQKENNILQEILFLEEFKLNLVKEKINFQTIENLKILKYIEINYEKLELDIKLPNSSFFTPLERFNLIEKNIKFEKMMEIKKEFEKEAKELKKQRLKKKLRGVFAFKTVEYNDTSDFFKQIASKQDSLSKYEEIKEYCLKNKKKFIDYAFPNDQTSLGNSLTSIVKSWSRPANGKRVINGIEVTDVEQGLLGDCYFLSGLSVLGSKNTEKLFLSDPIIENEIGAYLIRFFNENTELYVIIDDFFPLNHEDKWVFAKSEDENELWPMVLEKAYAKLYGSYENIVGGRLNFALSDLTGGFPDEIKLEKFQQNQLELFRKLISFKEKGYLLGASTPEIDNKEKNTSFSGILQGHAYAILDCVNIDENMLIKLRNPHGSKGIEWKGEWSDNSNKWTNEMKNKIGFESKDDGIFFMGIEDFVYEFKTLFICRIFPENIWNHYPIIKGEWKNESAAGLPSKKLNPNCDIKKNPQYGIKIFKETNLFIVLTQKQLINMFQGKIPIFFMIHKNEGNKIRSATGKNMIASTGNPIDLKSVSCEVLLKAEEYPYTFSLLVASLFGGEKGEGEFEIRIVSDREIKFEELSN